MSWWRPRARAVFHVVALVEAVTWVGLLAGMGAHYLGGASRAGIEVFGPLHGAAFVSYLVVALAAARALRWRPWVVVLALAAAVPPLATLVFDVLAGRRGWLGARPGHTPAPAPYAATRG